MYKEDTEDVDLLIFRLNTLEKEIDCWKNNGIVTTKGIYILTQVQKCHA